MKRIFMILFSILLLISCEFGVKTFPFLIENLECSLDSENDIFNHIGLRFKMSNTSKKTIKNFTACFIIYDSKNGKNPLITSNYIEAKFNGNLDCNKSKIFEVSLDDKINYVPKNPFYIDCFYIKSIVYEDGSTWKNYFSSYTISGDQL